MMVQNSTTQRSVCVFFLLSEDTRFISNFAHINPLKHHCRVYQAESEGNMGGWTVSLQTTHHIHFTHRCQQYSIIPNSLLLPQSLSGKEMGSCSHHHQHRRYANRCSHAAEFGCVIVCDYCC